MKKYDNNQQGFVHLIVIIGLIVALVLLAILGWFFYQNATYKKSTQPAEADTTSTSGIPQAEETPNLSKEDTTRKAVTVLADWGVEVPLKDSSYGIMARKDATADAPKNTLYIESLQVASKCGNNGRIGAVNRSSSQATAKTKVNGKTYYFHRSQEVCSDDPSANEYMKNAIEVFEAGFKNLRATE